jgi:hypothetical protein
MPTVSSPSISTAWQRALELAYASPSREVMNLIVTISDLNGGLPLEDLMVRSHLDMALIDADLQLVRTVAGTIFPSSIWRPQEPRAMLYDRYLRMWPRIKKCRKNRRGTYFQRLMGYPSLVPGAFNQLEQVISTYLGGNHRRSALQASVIVPSADLTNARQQGFPCMQQVSFIPMEGRLHLVGFYPTQHLFERAYGNYLGLIHLGRFMAAEMGLILDAVTCMSVIAKLEQPGPAQALRLAERALQL